MTKDNPQKTINKHTHNKPVSKSLILDTIMSTSDDTIYFKDCDSNFIANSQAHSSQQGELNPEIMIGKSDFDYFPNDFATVTFEEEKLIMKSGKPKINNIEKWIQPDNSIIWLIASKYPLYDDEGQIIGTWGTSRDITALKNAEIQLELLNQKLKKANESLEALSIQDSLSGLYNHRHFYDSLALIESKLSRSGDLGFQSGYSIILLDIDYFKSINDTYGHLIGDLVIKQIGEYLSGNTRTIDLCFRYGGDEFALIIDGNNHEDALILSEKIRVMIENMPIRIKDTTLNITVSIGVVCSNDLDSVNNLVALADERLYHSKKTGRNKVT